MKIIRTTHPEIGYNNNVQIIESALGNHFGINDASGLQTTLAQHIWSAVCMPTYNRGTDEKEWGSREIAQALDVIEVRTKRVRRALAESDAAHTETLAEAV